MQPRYFASPEEFRRWLEQHHETETELLVGFYKVGSGKPSMTWPESVDEALSFGWIDGVRRRVDDERYTIRFTPRKPRSNWSAINVRRMAELERLGRVHPAGRRAFEQRAEERSGIYAYEKPPIPLSPPFEKRFRANRKGWKWFHDQAPSYRRQAIYWVMTAKREETRDRRLEQLIECSADARRLPQYVPRK